MSYNGIGLTSAKGSATSGHIQKNLAETSNTTTEKKYEFRKGQHASRLENERNRSKRKTRKWDARLVRYMEKRAVELRVAERRLELEQRYYNDPDETNKEKQRIVDTEVAQLRESLAQMAASQSPHLFDYRKLTSSETTEAELITAEDEADDMLKQLLY